MMKALLLGIASVLAAQPALAQYRQPYPYQDYRNTSPRQLIDQLARRVDNGVRFGMITREEARQLRVEADRLRRLEFEYGHDGFSSWERSTLARQIDRLRSDVLAAEQRRFGGSVIVPPRDPYARDYRWEAPPPRDDGRDRWEDRDDNSRYGGGVYDRDDDSRNGGPADSRDDDTYEGVNDDDPRYRIPDGDDDADGRRYEPGGGYPDELRVGDPAPVNLGLLPPELRSRYRDGNGVYYRYWNGTVYQVDSQTHTIRWIGRTQD